MFCRPLIKLSPPLCSKVHVCQQFPAFCLFVLNMLHPFLVHLSSHVPYIFITSTSISVFVWFLMSHITHFNVFRYTALNVLQCFLFNLGSAWIVFVYVIVTSTHCAITTSFKHYIWSVQTLDNKRNKWRKDTTMWNCFGSDLSVFALPGSPTLARGSIHCNPSTPSIQSDGELQFSWVRVVSVVAQSQPWGSLLINIYHACNLLYFIYVNVEWQIVSWPSLLFDFVRWIINSLATEPLLQSAMPECLIVCFHFL